jgi:selenocysteine lyase/cysteine desulfurase
MLATTDETRRLFAELVGAGEDEVGFLYSTTEGENVVVNSLGLRSARSPNLCERAQVVRVRV